MIAVFQAVGNSKKLGHFIALLPHLEGYWEQFPRGSFFSRIWVLPFLTYSLVRTVMSGLIKKK